MQRERPELTMIRSLFSWRLVIKSCSIENYHSECDSFWTLVAIMNVNDVVAINVWLVE